MPIENAISKEADKDTRWALQRLAREQLKQRVLNDVLIDMYICHLEGWDYKGFVRELKELLCNLDAHWHE